MYHEEMIMTLALGLGAALVFGIITHQLKISPIVGYLLAGILVGPHTPGLTANADIAQSFAEFGVVLLMFGVGLHFHFGDLLRVQKIVLPVAFLQITSATLLGVAAAYLWGWGVAAGIVFGLSIAVASTVVLIRVLESSNQLETPIGKISVGLLVVEDIFTVIALVLLPALFGPQAAPSWKSVVFNVWDVALKFGGLVLFTIFLGRYVIPWAWKIIEKTKSKELFTLAVLFSALGLAVGASMFFGVSMALGAFLAGMIVGRNEFASRAAEEALPMRDAFAVLFFVSVGMLFDPATLWERWKEVLLTVAIIIVGKPLAAFVILAVMRQGARVALSISAAISQIGEFSFIMATAGTALGVLPPEALQIIVAASVISIILNPMIYNCIPKANLWIKEQPWLKNAVAQDE